MERIKSVLFVVNPISGSIDKSQLIELVKKEVAKIKASLEIFFTTGEEDVFNLKLKIEEERPSRIVIAGGDGTIKIVAEAIQELNIPVGIIPAGSANGLAINLPLPTTIEDQVVTALGREFMELDILKINDEYCLHMSDFGLNAELIHRFENSSLRGKIGYLLQSIPTIIQSEYPFQFKIEANGLILNKEGILLAIANARMYGTGATVNPKGKIDDGLFEVLIFKNFDVLEILKTLRNETEFDSDFVEIIKTNKAKISCSSPVAFQIDGEYLGEKNFVKVEVLPHKLHLSVLPTS